MKQTFLSNKYLQLDIVQTDIKANMCNVFNISQQIKAPLRPLGHFEYIISTKPYGCDINIYKYMLYVLICSCYTVVMFQ